VTTAPTDPPAGGAPAEALEPEQGDSPPERAKVAGDPPEANPWAEFEELGIVCPPL
jgi:hypothetical protein